MKKYSRKEKTPPTLNIGIIKIVSKKIMLALQFIYSKGLYYGKNSLENIILLKHFFLNKTFNQCRSFAHR